MAHTQPTEAHLMHHMKHTALPQRILIIQTASLGDVILSTALAETLHQAFPGTCIDFLVKKGYEHLFLNHPFVSKVHCWDKKNHKYRNLFRIIRAVRNSHYNAVINVQRFASSGLITALSGAPIRSGFSKNPFSFTFTHKAIHTINANGSNEHEIQRNHHLISFMKEMNLIKPAIYPGKNEKESVLQWTKEKYITISPASLWFTKQYPIHKWIDFVSNIPQGLSVILLGSKDDKDLCQSIMEANNEKRIYNLAGELSFLQSAALMQQAEMNFVNDSAPQHMASSVNAPVTAIFCSTVPAFGFGPVSDNAVVIETKDKLDCRPCGLHGWQKCPEGHFNCAESITTQQLLNRIKR